MYMEEKKGQVIAFGFSTHNLTMTEAELAILWPGRRFVSCMNVVELYRRLQLERALPLGENVLPLGENVLPLGERSLSAKARTLSGVKRTGPAGARAVSGARAGSGVKRAASKGEAGFKRGTGGISLLVNLSREFHELDGAIRLADWRGIPVIGAVATDFVNAYSLRLCMDRELPAIIGEIAGRDELGEARDAIRAGRRFVPRSLLRGEGYRFVDLPVCLSLLSDNEALCVSGRVGGLSVKEIAACLGTSDSSVRTYVSRAFGKLGVSTTEELAWLIAGHPLGCYHGERSTVPLRLFPARMLHPATKKPEQAGA